MVKYYTDNDLESDPIRKQYGRGYLNTSSIFISFPHLVKYIDIQSWKKYAYIIKKQ